MTAGDARHGRRDNGLVAAEYAAAGDVDPRVGEHLLDVLALDGIAAYLRPSTDLHPVTRSTILPSRPTDRLYVDRAHVATARDYLAKLAREASETEPRAREATETEPRARDTPVDTKSPGEAPQEEQEETAAAHPAGTSWLSGAEVDAAWAEIIAGYADTAEPHRAIDPPADPPTDPPTSSRTELTSGGRPVYYRLTPPSHPRPTPTDEPSLLDGLDTFGADLPDDENERFTPPVPPPMPRPSTPTVLAIIGIVGGLAVFLNPDLLFFLNNGLAMFLGFTAIVSGFGTLVWRLRPGDEDDDTDPDNGAKV
jgi:hypothetical protein